MILFAIRIIIYSILPLLMAGTVILIDRTASTRERRLEVFLIFLFALGVAGSGIGGFFGHLFLSDQVAESIGWSIGSPFQLEMGFANLALGVLGIIAVSRRDGFREATVIAVAIIGVGATVVHIMDIIQTGNLAPGNTIQNVSNLLRPALLIGILVAARRAEAKPDSEVRTPEFDQWRAPLGGAAGIVTAIIATAFALGFGFGQPGLLTLFGIILSFAILIIILLRSPLHQTRWSENIDPNS
jgi:4-amino-4-deoxy-L-arabinose transferase-like glycosyltransferase